ncbi:MAG: carnitine 3-dehydrogenase, partial [Acidimicrobiaceae bacterium]|nr:carnitine 3-dehydrogenase [Acidimicrobiaceae bacterium]
VEPDWVDYNGHMTEWAFLAAFGWASDALFRYIGIDEAYRAGGHSYYTVETHLNHLREASEGERLRITTQVLGSDRKRLHIFHAMYRAGEPLCTGEQMLVHVDTAAGRSAPLLDGPAAAVAAIGAAHASMPPPPEAGRRIAIGAMD